VNTILSQIKNNPIDYLAEIKKCEIIVQKKDNVHIGVVVPVRGRVNFLPTLLDTLQNTRQNCVVDITIVEDSSTPEHKPTCSRYGVNYIWRPNGGVFNKCLAFNLGVFLGNKSKWLICHDLDILVQKDFFIMVLQNLHNQESLAVQSFSNHKPVNCDEFITEKLLHGAVDINELRADSSHTFRVRGDAPGGSISILRDLFFTIGGYDPELFTGYSPEDRFFIDKIKTYVALGTCEDPIVHVFHMHHPPTMNTNPYLKSMIAVAERFARLHEKNRTQIIRYKEKLIAQYK